MKEFWLSGEKEVFIDGDMGPIQAGFTPGESRDTALLVCHPHPQAQGTMFNKVVTTIVQAGKSLGFPVCRFNYRGVGASVGVYDHAIGEMADAIAVAKWLLLKTGCRKVWLTGFSFGACIAYNIQEKIPCTGVILVCPSIEKMRFNPAAAPTFVVQASEDEIVSAKAVVEWARQNSQEKVQVISGAGHFYHGKLLELKEVMIKILEKAIG